MFPAMPELSPNLAFQDESTNFNLEGKISKLESGKLTISTEDNIIFHVTYGDKTEIKHEDGSAGSANDFHLGLRVRVEGDLTEAGIVAKRIVIQKEADSKPPPAPNHRIHQSSISVPTAIAVPAARKGNPDRKKGIL
jgi:hypothetical protein